MRVQYPHYINERGVKLVYLLICLIAISPAFALDGKNRNWLLIIAMAITPSVFLVKKAKDTKIEVMLFVLLLLMSLFPLLFHPESWRTATLAYSWLFCIYFIAYTRILNDSSFHAEHLLKVTKYLLFAYCIVLMIQQSCVLLKLPIFNVSNWHSWEPWKLNSLMSEPSHSARVISVLMYIYVLTKSRICENYTLRTSLREDFFVWLAFMWCALTMGSSTAILFMTIVFMHFLKLRHILTSASVVLLLVAIIWMISDMKIFQRANDIFYATMTFDEELIMKTDLSGAVRIVPSIRGAKAVEVFSVNGWIGNGIDSEKKMIEPLKTLDYGSAGAFSLWVNYGLVVAFMFWIFSLRTCWIKSNYVSLLIWFICIFIVHGINNQILWLTLIMIYTYKHTIRHSMRKKITLD